jgi:hypothetical protein
MTRRQVHELLINILIIHINNIFVIHFVTTTHFKILGTIFKILNVIGRHPIFMNTLLEIEQGSYA